MRRLQGPANGFLLPASFSTPGFPFPWRPYNSSHLLTNSNSLLLYLQQLKFSNQKESSKLSVLLIPPSTIKTMSSLRFSGDKPGSGRRQHFLDACFLCKKPIARNEDIFMYRGDTPFCSRECRWEQMDMDQTLEKARVNSSSSLPMKRKPTLISVPSNCEEKNCFGADATAIVAG